MPQTHQTVNIVLKFPFPLRQPNVIFGNHTTLLVPVRHHTLQVLEIPISILNNYPCFTINNFYFYFII